MATKTAERPRTKPQHKPSARTLNELREKKPISIPRLSGWVVSGLLVLLTLIFHSSILFGGKFLWEDFVEQEFPFRTLATTSLANGILPHWDPYVFAGSPFLADIQVAFWYPFNMLQSLFVSGGYLSPVVMEWFILLHYAVAGIGMWFFAKKIFQVDDWSALFAGIAYAFSGYIVAQAIHQMIVYHMALFPWAAALFVLGFSDWKKMIGSGLVLGAMYLAGHPQSTLYFTFALGLLAIYEIVYRLRHKTEPLDALTVVRMGVPIVIGLGIFAIQLLPSQELAALSRRDVITFEKSVEGSLSWGHLMTLILPRLFGLTNGANDAKVPYWNGAYYNSWETAIYIGVLPLFFAIMAVLTSTKRKYVPFFAGLSVFAVLFALGDHFFFYKLFFQLPLFSKLRTPARMMMVFSFSACALSAVGLSNAMNALTEERSRKMILVVLGVLVLPWLLAIAGAIHAASFVPGISAEADQSISWAAGLATFPVLALIAIGILTYLGKLRGMPLAALAIAVTLVELFTYGMSLNASPEDPRLAYRESYQPQREIVSQLQQDQKKEMSRAQTRLANQMVLKRNQGAYDKIQLMEGYNPLVLQRVLPEMARPEANADLMNVKWSILQSQQGLGWGERQGYIPRVKMYYKADVLPDEQARARLKQDSSYDYRSTIMLEEQPEHALGTSDPNATARVTKYTENEIVTSATTAAPGMLFFSEVWYPAWKAYVDDKPAKLYRAFGSLRAVSVPAGSHTVSMRYESDAFRTGSLITIATLLLSLGGLGAVMMRGRGKGTVPTAEEDSQKITAA